MLQYIIILIHLKKIYIYKHQISIINTAKSRAGNNWTNRGHEILHSIVYKAFKASGKAFKPMAESMLTRLAETDADGCNGYC